MTFGAIIKNQHGKSVISDHEETYMFYKRVESTFGSSGGVTIDLHTPRVWKPMVFLNVGSIGLQKFESLGAAVTSQTEGSLKASVYNYNNSRQRKYTWYVFLPCSYFNPPEWGMVINKPDGTPAFHTGRPLLHIKDVVSRDVGITSHPFNPAAGCNPLAAKYMSTPGSSITYGFLTGLGSSDFLGTRNATGRGAGIIGSGYEIPSSELSSSFPVIDADYYRNIPNATPSDMVRGSLQIFVQEINKPPSFAVLPENPNFKGVEEIIGESLDPAYEDILEFIKSGKE